LLKKKKKRKKKEEKKSNLGPGEMSFFSTACHRFTELLSTGFTVMIAVLRCQLGFPKSACNEH
jgi:hypothetical protein